MKNTRKFKKLTWRKTVRSKDPDKKSIDKQLFFLTLSLVVFGIVMVYNTSVVTAFQDFDDKFYFAKLQSVWAFIGILAMLIIAKIPYTWWKFYAKFLLYGTIGLLILVLLPGVSREIYGARRWLSIGNLTVQPAELAKFTLTIYLASALSEIKSGTEKLKHKKDLTLFLVATGLVLGLVIGEPDLGTALVLAGTAVSIYWAAGAPLKHFLILLGGGVVSVLSLTLISPYRAARLQTFFDPSQDPLGSSYHIRQVLYAIGSGGWNGLGLGQSRQKYAYLPEVTTDSIFAVIAEEIGFLGSLVIIFIFMLLIIKGLRIASKPVDQYGKLLATGMITWIGLQTVINFSAMVVLVPLTGIPLPFLSYGGSSLVVALSSIGILLNISKNRK